MRRVDCRTDFRINVAAMSAYTIRMLVADNSRTVLMFFKHIVERSTMPIELVTAETGAACREILAQGAVDLAFIDINMPEMSGLEAVGRARFGGNQTFVTLMSGKASEDRFDVARQIRAYEYLVKPFTAADVEVILRNYRTVSKRMKALIVDDTKTIRRILRRVLTRSIFRLDIQDAGSGERAVAMCRDTAFDLILLDVNMPGLDGIETLRQIRARDTDCKVVMISAEHNDDLVARALELGAAAFLHKPFFAHDVDRALHKALGLKLPGLTASLPERTPRRTRQDEVCLPDDNPDAAVTLVNLDDVARWGIEDGADEEADGGGVATLTR